jgi:hypothetical protein
MYLKDIFISISGFTLWTMAMTFEDVITWLLFWKDAHHQDWLWDNTTLQRHFYIVILGYPLKYSYDSWQTLSHSDIWMNIKMMHVVKTDYETIYFEAKVHFIAWIWVIRLNIIDNSNVFLFMIWLDRLRIILSIQQWAFYCKLWDACLDDWIVSKKAGDNIYLKSMVLTGGKSVAD